MSKNNHPNTSQKWDGYRWITRTKEHEVRKEEIKEQHGLVALYELSLRTGTIAVYLAKVKQYANDVDKGVTKMRSLASRLTSAKTPEMEKKVQGELWNADAYVLQSLRKMDMYSALVSASGGLGADRTYKLLKQKMGKKKRK